MKKIILPIIISLLIIPICLSTDEITRNMHLKIECETLKCKVEELEGELNMITLKKDIFKDRLSRLQESSDRKAKRREQRITGLKEEVKKYEDEVQQLKSDVKEKEEKIAELQEQAKQYDGNLKGLKRDLEEAKKTNEELKLSQNAIKEEDKEEIFRLKQELVSLTLKNSQKNNALLNLVDTSVQTDNFTTSPTSIPDIIRANKGVGTDQWDSFSMPGSEDKSREKEKGWSTPQVARISILGAIITLLVYRLTKHDKQQENTPQASLDKTNHTEEVR